MNRQSLRPYAKRAYMLAQRFQHRRGYRIKREADGMLRPYVYEAIYDAVKLSPDGDWLEIGGARGGSTVAIATAMRDSGKRGTLTTVEKFEGGSWEKTYKSPAYGDNYSWWQRNVRKFGVQDRVNLYPHGVSYDTADEVKHMIHPPLTGMMLDADGWVGRDFRHFWPLIRDGGIIVIDDYVADVERELAKEKPHEKKVRTHYLMNAIIRWGLYEITERHADTVIGFKPPGADFNRFDMGELEYIVERHKRGEHTEW